MISEIKPTPKYGKYFLASEADEVDTPDIKFNTKVITVKPSSRRTKFFNIGDDYFDFGDDEDVLSDDATGIEPEDENTPEDGTTVDLDTGEVVDTPADDSDTPEDGTTVDLDTGEVVNAPSDGNENPPDGTTVDLDTGEVVDQPGNTQTETPADGTTVDLDTGEVVNTPEDPLVQSINDVNNEIDSQQNQTDDSQQNADENPAIDENPISVDDNDQQQTDETEDQPADGNTESDKRGPGIEYDSTRKYVLFKKFIALCDAIKDYNNKFSQSFSENQTKNGIYKIAANKLNDIYSVTYDYLTMKFELSTYVQSLLFYQERIASVYKVFDFVSSSIETLSKKEK